MLALKIFPDVLVMQVVAVVTQVVAVVTSAVVVAI